MISASGETPPHTRIMTNINALTAKKFDDTILWLRQQWFDTTDEARKTDIEDAIHQVRLQRERQGFGYGL